MRLAAGGRVVDVRAADAEAEANPALGRLWRGLLDVVATGPGAMGLLAGERPRADVEVLAGLLGATEYALAVWMHGADEAGSLPLPGPGGMLAARGWGSPWARRLSRCAEFVAAHAGLAQVWAAGVITSDHVDPIARAAHRFTAEELAAVLDQLTPHWGAWSPAAVARFLAAADRMLHPPSDPAADEADAYESRDLSFAITGDSVLLSGALPRVEGELVIAAIDAFADRLRSTADHVPAGSRRADALVQLVNAAQSKGALPMRGGLPVALTVTLEHTRLGDPIWSTSRGHQLTLAEQRWSGCDCAITPILVDAPLACEGGSSGGNEAGGPTRPPRTTEGDAPPTCSEAGRMPAVAQAGGSIPAGFVPTPAARIAALAELMFDTRLPLAVGRTQRSATPAQRRALAIRDRGCIIPGCGIPAGACQTHHLVEWAQGGETTLENLALLCWAHHRQVDLQMWTIRPVAQAAGPPQPEQPAPRGVPWPANHGAPFEVTRVPRSRWRL